MIGVAGAIVGAAPPVSAPVLVLVQQPPDSPFADILGWVIVFFVVIWPIVKGLLDNAKSQRKKFEESQRGRTAKAKTTARTERRSRIDEFLEEMISARPDSVETETPPPSETPPPVPKAPRRPKPEPEPVEQLGADFAVDPFDESFLESDLVPQKDLVDVPEEDVIEATGPYANAMSELDDSAMDDVIGVESKGPAETPLERIQRRHSPWQAAFILKEVLGPPASSRSYDQLPR